MTFFVPSRRGAGLLLNPYDKRGTLPSYYGDGYAYDVPYYWPDATVLNHVRYGGSGNFQSTFDQETGTYFKDASTDRCFKIKGQTNSLIFRIRVEAKMTWWGKGYLTPNIGGYWGDGVPSSSPQPPWSYGQGVCTTKFSTLYVDRITYDSGGTPINKIWAVQTYEMDPGSGIVTNSYSEETTAYSVTTPPGSQLWYSGFYYREEGQPISIDQLEVNPDRSHDWLPERCYLIARDKSDSENPAYSISSNSLTEFPFSQYGYASQHSYFYAFQSDQHSYSYGKVKRELKIYLEVQTTAVPRDCCWLSGLKIKGAINFKVWNLQTVLGPEMNFPTQIVATPDQDETINFEETISEWAGQPWYYAGTIEGQVMLLKTIEVELNDGIAKAIEDFSIESVEYS